MNLREFLIQEHNSLVNELGLRYSDVLRTSRKRSFHRLRLAMKRHSAFLRLLKSMGFQFIMPGGREYWKDLYSEIGSIRDCQVGIKLVQTAEQDLNVVFPYSQTLEQSELNSIQGFHKNHDKKRQNNINFYLQEVSARLEKSDFIEERMNEYFSKKILAVGHLIKVCQVEKSGFHRLRKNLKELLYNLDMLNRMNGKEAWTQEIEEWRVLARALGEWNDYVTVSHEMDDPKSWVRRIRQSIEQTAFQKQDELVTRLPYWQERAELLKQKWEVQAPLLA